MLEQTLLFTGCSSVYFFNSSFVTYGTPCCARGHHSHLIFCDLQDTIPLLSSLTTFVTCDKSCHARGHHSHFPCNPYLGKQKIYLGVGTSKNAFSKLLPIKFFKNYIYKISFFPFLKTLTS